MWTHVYNPTRTYIIRTKKAWCLLAEDKERTRGTPSNGAPNALSNQQRTICQQKPLEEIFVILTFLSVSVE